MALPRRTPPPPPNEPEPGPRRIDPADLPSAMGRSSTPSATPSTPDCSPNSSSSAQDCQWCSGAGWYLEARPYGHPNFGKPMRCQCGQQADKQRLNRLALERLGNELGALADRTFATFDLDRELGDLLELGGAYYPSRDRIPPAELKAHGQPKSISPAAQRSALHKAYLQAQDYAAQLRGWLVLYGAYGSGKSHLAAAIGHVAAERGLAVRYRSLPALFDVLMRGFKDDSSDAIFDDLLGCDLLILDDLFDSDIRASDWRRSRLFRMFNERETRPIVITSNRRFDDLAPASDVDFGRLCSRMSGQASQVWMPISDARPFYGVRRVG